MKRGPKPKLSDDQVADVLLLKASGMKLQLIAEKFDVGISSIKNIVMRKTMDPARVEAKKLHKTLFVSQIPCKYGHIGERYTKNGNCITCLRKDKKKYVSKKEPSINANWWEHLESALRATV